MRESEFWRLVDEEFGAGYGRVLASDQTLTEIGHRTATEAMNAGVPVREIWIALCRQMNVPQERWLGRDIPVTDHGFDA